MASDIANASIACCFLTPQYEISDACRKQLELVNQTNVEIIPCLVTPNWSPTSTWLKSFINGIRYVDFRSTDNIRTDHAITKLAQRIVDTFPKSNMMKPIMPTNIIIPPIPQVRKPPKIVVDLPSNKIVQEDDRLELRLVTDGLGSFYCKWLFNEQDIILSNSAAILSMEEYDKACCLYIEHFQPQHVGEYQVVLTNAAGIVVKSKSIMCTIGKTPEILADESESQVISVHGENFVNRCQGHAAPEAIITRTWPQNNTTYSIDRSLDGVGYERDTRTQTANIRQCEIDMRW
ncbi:unnamed protein product [Rotaria sp. Silwood1]|nr:unnamed protein product [Rotaria sp. Silwood1]